MNIKKLSQVGGQINPHGVLAQNLFNSENSIITVITLKEGQKLRKHITHTDVLFFVLQGYGEVVIGEETAPCESGTLIESPKGVPLLVRGRP